LHSSSILFSFKFVPLRLGAPVPVAVPVGGGGFCNARRIMQNVGILVMTPRGWGGPGGLPLARTFNKLIPRLIAMTMMADALDNNK
jgi:hypothetical protein